MKVVLSLFILLALPFQELFAQSFKGKIIDATTKRNLSFANVVLLQADGFGLRYRYGIRR